MVRLISRFPCLVLATLAAATFGCAPKSGQNPILTATVPPAVAVTRFTDPFAYCAAVGTLDSPDARYTGTLIPDAVINGFKQAAGLSVSTEPLDVFRKTTVWRCMEGKVFACNFGANLPCDSKADTNRTPSPEMADYCKANPGADFIPMSVTGHASVYSWHCVKNAPEVLDQIGQVDAAGYLAQIWYEIQPSP